MNLQARFADWANKMGYTGDTSKLSNFVNSNTEVLWEKIMFHFHPKTYCESVRGNILLNDLENNLDESKSCEELKVWKKKCELEKQLSFIKKQIKTTEAKIDKLAKENQVKYKTVENVNSEIKQLEHYKMLLNIKIEDLETKIKSTEKTIETINQLTPVDTENKNDENQLRQKCHEMMELMLQEKHEKNTSNSYSDLLCNSFDEYFICPDQNTSVANLSTMTLKEINETLNSLLYTYNQAIISKCLQNNIEEAVQEFLKCLENNNPVDINSYSITTMYAVHTRNKLKTIKLKVEIKQLRKEIDKLMKQIMQNQPQASQALLIKIQAVELIETEKQIMRKIEQFKKIDFSLNQLKLITAQTALGKIQTEMPIQVKEITDQVMFAESYFDKLNRKLIEVSKNTNMLKCQFFIDLNWLRPLTQNKNYEKLIAHYNYNEQNITNTNDKFFFSPLENIVFNLLKQKIYISNLKSLANKNELSSCVKNKRQNFTCEQDCIQNNINMLCKLLQMLKSEQNIIDVEIMQKIMKMWIEMPFKHYMSNRRLVDGKNYKHYDDMLKFFFQDL